MRSSRHTGKQQEEPLSRVGSRTVLIVLFGVALGIAAWFLAQASRDHQPNVTVLFDELAGVAFERPAANARGHGAEEPMGRISSPELGLSSEFSAATSFTLPIQWLTLPPTASDLEGLSHAMVESESGLKVTCVVGPDALQFSAPLPAGRYSLSSPQGVVFYSTSLQVTESEKRPVVFAGHLVPVQLTVLGVETAGIGGVTVRYRPDPLYAANRTTPAARVALKRVAAQGGSVTVTDSQTVRVFLPRLQGILSLSDSNDGPPRYELDSGGRAFADVAPVADQSVVLTLRRLAVVTIRLVEEVTGTWSRFATRLHDQFVAQEESALARAPSRNRPAAGWRADGTISLRVCSPATGQSKGEVIKVERVDSARASERTGVICEKTISLSLAGSDTAEVILVLEYEVRWPSRPIAFTHTTLHASADNHVNLTFGEYFPSLVVGVAGQDLRPLRDQGVHAAVVLLLDTGVPVVLGASQNRVSDESGLIELRDIVLPKGCVLKLAKEKLSLAASSEGLRAGSFSEKLTSGALVDMCFVLPEGLIDPIRMTLTIVNDTVDNKALLGRYHVVPFAGNVRPEIDSGAMTLDPRGRLSTRIVEPGEYHVLLVGNFGTRYQTVRTDVFNTCTITISDWKPLEVSPPGGGTCVLFPRNVPAWLCWSLLHRWADAERAAFPFHTVTGGRSATIPIQGAATDHRDYWCWHNFQPFSCEYTSGSDESRSVSQPLVEVVLPELPNAPDASYFLIVTAVFVAGDSTETALAMFGLQQEVSGGDEVRRVELPVGTYWVAVIVRQRDGSTGVAAKPVSGHTVSITGTGHQVRLVRH